MKILALISLALLAFSNFSQAQNLTPGIWHAQTDFRVDGIPLPASTGDSCVTPDDAKDAKSTLTKNLDKIGCVITDWNVVNDHLDASLECKNNQVEAKGKIQGDFTDKSYDLKGQAHGFYQHVIPSVASLRLHGQWVSDCAPTN